MPSYLKAMLLSILSGAAVADELPSGSLLKKYGISAEMLPKLAEEDLAKKMSDEPVMLFRIKPEAPKFELIFKETKRPETTGNITIDRINNRDHINCEKKTTQKLKKNRPIPSVR